MNVKMLRKKALDGTLEVEDMLKAAMENPPGLSAALRKLVEDCGWTRGGLLPDGSREIPFLSWAEVAIAYADEGFAGLLPLAGAAENAPFVLGLVEEMRTAAALAFILEAFAGVIEHPDGMEEVAFAIASALNLMLSFKPSSPITAAQATTVQSFLFSLYPLATTEARRASVILALRGVGDEDAVRFLANVAEFFSPWQETKKVTLRAIRKRLKNLP